LPPLVKISGVTYPAVSSVVNNKNKVILLDGTIDHDYTIISDLEAIVIHIPQDTRIIDALLKPKYTTISQ
jgi:hypothetical protein